MEREIKTFVNKFHMLRLSNPIWYFSIIREHSIMNVTTIFFILTEAFYSDNFSKYPPVVEHIYNL